MNLKNQAWYALRKTLPVWSFEDNLKELIEYLPQYRVDELIVKVDTEEFSHGQPSLEWVEKYQPKLFRIKGEMEKLGIVYSLNPWATLGHADRGRDDRQRIKNLQTLVGHDGIEATSCACPLSEAWRENTEKVWTLYAETKPRVLWVEDDMRTFNHTPITYSCFCPIHMRRFSERVGEDVSRTDLVNAILAPGNPHPWRKKFLDMQGDIMTETVAFLAKTVHRTSPETSMGLMSSGPRYHCLEGRKWNDFANALADGKELYSRPPTGIYTENSLRDNYYAHDSIKITREVLPDNVIEQSEVDNWTFTRYTKSINFTFLQMAISFAYGCHGVTLNLFDQCGTSMERTPEFGRLLSEKKNFLNTLAEKAVQKGDFRGVMNLRHEKTSYVKKLAEKSPYSGLLNHGFISCKLLETYGIPTVYGDENVVLATGQTINAFSDSEIENLLKKGILLDSVAAKIIFERGYGKYIGLESIDDPISLDQLGAYGAEEFFNEKFGGADKKLLSMASQGSNGARIGISRIKAVADVEVISCLVDPDAKRAHTCMYAFENELGGRVILSCLEIGTHCGPKFNNEFRAEQLRAAVKWLSRDSVPLIVEGEGVFPLAFRKDCRDFTLVGMFNLSLDPWTYTKFTLSITDDFSTPKYLSSTGEWKCDNKNIHVSREGDKMIIKVHKVIPFNKPFFLILPKNRK